MDPDATWLFLSEVWCPHAYEPPHPTLRPVKLGGMGEKRNEFTDNVQRLLDELQWREGAGLRPASGDLIGLRETGANEPSQVGQICELEDTAC